MRYKTYKTKPIKHDVTNKRYVPPGERQEIINKLRLA